MGSIFGFFAGLGMVGGALSGELEGWGLGVFAIAAVVGVLLLPQTVGTFMTGVMFMSPIAAVAGLISGHSSSALTALGIGLGAFATQFLVGLLRGAR